MVETELFCYTCVGLSCVLFCHSLRLQAFYDWFFATVTTLLYCEMGVWIEETVTIRDLRCYRGQRFSLDHFNHLKLFQIEKIVFKKCLMG